MLSHTIENPGMIEAKSSQCGDVPINGPNLRSGNDWPISLSPLYTGHEVLWTTTWLVEIMVFFLSISHREDQFESHVPCKVPHGRPPLLEICVDFCSGMCHWIGFVGKNLTGNPWVFTIKYRGFRLKCSLKPIQWMCQALVANGSRHGMTCCFLQSLSHSCFEVHLLYLMATMWPPCPGWNVPSKAVENRDHGIQWQLPTINAWNLGDRVNAFQR